MTPQKNSPAANRAADVLLAGGPRTDPNCSTGTGLQRRRAAALRLPPLESGYRDPLDEIPAMSAAATRSFCNELASMGFDLAYLEHRFGVRRAEVN